MVIENKDGELLTEKEEVLKRWTEYCKELYNYPIRCRPPSINADHGIEPIPCSVWFAAPHVAVQANARTANSATDGTFVGSVAVGVAGEE